MSDRFANLYQPLDKFDFRALVDDWSSHGITLENPATRRVSSLSPDGDQVDTSLEMLEATVLQHFPVTFQLWLTDDTDLCCRIRLLGDGRLVEEYSLVGLSREEMDRALKTLVERFKAKSKAAVHANLFLVADREGYTIDLNWDQLSVTGKYEARFCPDVLVIPIERSFDFRQCVDTNNLSVRFGEYLIVTISEAG
jgi:hypothetical protein